MLHTFRDQDDLLNVWLSITVKDVTFSWTHLKPRAPLLIADTPELETFVALGIKLVHALQQPIDCSDTTLLPTASSSAIYLHTLKIYLHVCIFVAV
jgi:hypothetical protein